MIPDRERRPGLATEAAGEDRAKSLISKVPDRAEASTRSAHRARSDSRLSSASLASLVGFLFTDHSPLEREMGRVLRALMELHLVADDGRCGRCGTPWPCSTHKAVETIVEQHIGVLASEDWSE